MGLILWEPWIWPAVALDQSVGRTDSLANITTLGTCVNDHNLYLQPCPLSWSARSKTKAWSMNFTFLLGAPERATTGVLAHGPPAAESVDQVRKTCPKCRTSLLLFEALSSCFFGKWNKSLLLLGYQSRLVFCTIDNESYPDYLCASLPRPQSNRTCNPHACPQVRR